MLNFEPLIFVGVICALVGWFIPQARAGVAIVGGCYALAWGVCAALVLLTI